MNLVLRRRSALGTVFTTLMFIVFAFAFGIAALSFSQQNFQTFTNNLSIPFANHVNRIQESLVIENVVFHNSTQQFNVTLTNTGYIPINVTGIMIQPNTTPSFNETARTSSTSPVSLVTMPNSLSTTSEVVTVPGAVIMPGQDYTTVIPYHCFCDPITVTAKTSRGTVITKNVAPNVGWFDSREQFRKRITVNLPQVVGNPSPIILDNIKSYTGTTSANSITFSGFTVNSGINRLLLVGIVTDGATINPNGVTYNGIKLVKANSTIGGSNKVDSEIWYLTNPPSGTFSLAVQTSGSANVILGAYSFFGVDQTTPIAEGNVHNGSPELSATTSFSTTYPQSWVVDSIGIGYSTSLFANSGQTLEWSVGAGSGNGIEGGSSYHLVNNPSSISDGYTWNPGHNTADALVAVELRSSAFYDFPLLVNMTDTNLFQNVQSNVGNDIVFTACDGMTKLNYEIENYTSSNGALTAWVRLPQLYSTPNNVVYMYYDFNNAPINSITNFQGTWDSTYSGVWHFAHSPPSTLGIPPQIDNIATNATNSTLSLQHILKNFAVGNHNDRLLLVGVGSDHPNTYKSITYGGQPLTKVPGFLNNVDNEFWYLLNPPVGSANILATLNSGGGGQQVKSIGAYSLYGVDQITPIAPNYPINYANSGTTVSVTITNIFTNSLLIDQAGVGYGAQCGGCHFTHPPYELKNPTKTQKYIMDITYDTLASSLTTASQACTTTNFQWTESSTNQPWVDIAVEVKSDSAIGDTTIQDSTTHQNYLFPANLPTCGQTNGIFGGGLSLNGVNQFLTRNSSLTGMPNINAPQTVSSWFWSPTSSRGIFPQVFDSLQYDQSAGSIALRTGLYTSTSTDVWKFSPVTNIETTSVPSLSHWHYTVYTFNGTQSKLYIDGIKVATSTVTPPSTSPPTSLYIGADTSNNNADTLGQYFNGYLDEFRYAKVVRSASWIATEYNNQAQPSTFITIGSQESVLTPRPLG